MQIMAKIELFYLHILINALVIYKSIKKTARKIYDENHSLK